MAILVIAETPPIKLKIGEDTRVGTRAQSNGYRNLLLNGQTYW